MTKLRFALATVFVLALVTLAIVFTPLPRAHAQSGMGPYTWVDLGSQVRTPKAICQESPAAPGVGADLCLTRATAGHVDFATGTGAVNKDFRGTGTSPLTVTFTTAYTAAPVCVASDQSGTPAAIQVAPTTTQVVLTGTAGHTLAYVCFGQ